MVARRFPPATSFPCIDIVWTARHACKPPRAATFLSTMAAADSLACEGVSPPAAPRETANASDIEMTSDFRNIATSFEDLRLRLELSIGSRDIFFLARHQAPSEPTPVTPEASSETLIDHQSVSSKSPNHHAYTVSAFQDRKSTRLNSSHQIISYAVFCLKKKKT